jgi:uncharacterized phiE125 gp8 family phage protein
MRLTLITPPASEPVLLADAKNHLRVDTDQTADDSLITMLIAAARRYAESYTGRAFITQTWRATRDGFPGFPISGLPYAGIAAYTPDQPPSVEITLAYGPVQSITSVSYQDMTGAWITMPVTDYVFDASGLRPRLAPAYGKSWPVTLPQIGSVRIDYVAGYGTAAATVPEGIRQWILLRINTMYENREEVAILGRGKVEALPFVDGLLDPYRVPVL